MKLMRIVQLSDLHQFSDPTQSLLGMDPNASLDAVLMQLRQLIPKADLLLLTGDLAQDEQPRTYQRLAKIIDVLAVPTYWLAGNHDLPPEAIAQHLQGQHISADKVIDLSTWRCILLNSQIPGEVKGQLTAKELTWLDRQLTAGQQQHCFVVLHHHPLPVNSVWIDNLALQNQTEFWQVIDKHPQVQAVICGHIHQDFHQQRQHVNVYSAPSTWVQFKPRSDEFAVDKTNSPGFRWYDLHSDGSIVTNIVRANNFAYVPPDDVDKGY